MIKEQELLEDALARKVITAEQFAQMSAMVEPTVNRNPDERFRVVSGFSEVFISIGLMILFGAVHGIFLLGISNAAVACILSGGFTWLAAGYFVEHKRYLFPSIVSCLYSAFYVGSALWLMQGIDTSHLYRINIAELDWWQILSAPGATMAILILAAWRYRIPFLMLPIGILLAIFLSLANKWGGHLLSYRIALCVSGLTMLGIALYFDLKDPHRVKRSSDFAFWCYVIGSPLTIHPLLISFIFNVDHLNINSGVLLAFGLILLSAIVSVVSLLLNRRALILSTLIYAGFSIGYLASHIVGGAGALVAMLIIGLYVVSLGTAWRKVRRTLMKKMTPRSWFAKLPPY